jgi:hypothetical protein
VELDAYVALQTSTRNLLTRSYARPFSQILQMDSKFELLTSVAHVILLVTVLKLAVLFQFKGMRLLTPPHSPHKPIPHHFTPPQLHSKPAHC